MIPRLVIASKNADKVTELAELVRNAALAGEVVEGLDWPEVEESGATLEDNARLKAAAVARSTGLPALADDTGLEVVALGGRPGVYSARYAGPAATYAENVAKLLREMEGISERSAQFVTAVALVRPGEETVVTRGAVEGRITDRRRGLGGFGYDPVFEVEGRTFAEMPPEEKNELSHRARAVGELAALLRDRPDDPRD